MARVSLNFSGIKQALQRSLRGAHMLAFLPALCLVAYWGGGEVLLVFCALLTPLVYALTGGFGKLYGNGAAIPAELPKLEEIAQDFLNRAQRSGQTTACFHLGLTGLDDISHSLGFSATDEARQILKRRLESVLRESDFVLQAGDDRLVLLIAPGFRLKLDNLLDIGKRVREAVEEPLSVVGTTRYVSTAVGIASSLSFRRGVSAETWLDSGSSALDEAMLNGASTIRIWSEKLSRQFQSRHALRDELTAALENGELQAHFQPQISLRSGAVTGMEALARWEHTTRGVLQPGEFLGILKEIGQMDRLGDIMLAQGLNALQSWDRAGFDVPTVSINVSTEELRNPELCERISRSLDQFGLTSNRLVLDIAETTLTNQNDDIAWHNLKALADFGCRLDLDDFGTGHSSITTLQRLPLNRLKIDRSLVAGVDKRIETKRMLSAILGMTERLGLDALAEGVETLGEHGVLRELGCTYAQGFLFAKPMSLKTCNEWLQDTQTASDVNAGTTLRRVK
ncbi:putative bifunctional diguanylate cyclase/phosphodiesterase [Marivita sp. S2033]|uniref:putative bifunctional diguanylate cyclase/phosphodiesterase n=1 Tax=Marivita sp. S2033 TaxID=3373187 RepID=UPI003982226D